MKAFLLAAGILLLITAAILVVKGFGNAFLMPPEYAATAMVLSSATTPAGIAAEIQTIQSTNLLTQVATNLDLPNRWGAKYHEGTLPLPIIWNLLKLHSTVRSVGNSTSGVIQIRVTSDSPQEAAEIANQTAEAYRAGARTTQILEKAMPVPRAVYPNKPKLLAFGCGLAALIGLLGAALIMMYMRSPRDVPPADKL